MARLAHIEEGVEELTDEVLAHRGGLRHVWQLNGGATTGKSTALRRLGERLEAEDFVTVYVDPPPGSRDAVQVGVAQVVEGFARAGEADEAVAVLERSEGLSWAAQRELVHGLIQDTQRHRDVVILCDEPGEWAVEEGHFRRKTETFLRDLLDESNVMGVVAGTMETSRDVRPVYLEAGGEYGEWLRDERQWGTIAESAEALGDLLGEELNERTALEVRLLVGVAALKGAENVAQRVQRHSLWRKRLSQWFAVALAEGPGDTAHVLQMWAVLEKVRGEIPDDLFGELRSRLVGEWSPFAEDLLSRCLTFRINGHRVLHELLRRDARDECNKHWLSSPRQVHQILADYYATQVADEETPVAKRLRLELEGYHHSTLVGDPDIEERFRVYFADQLTLLGRHISKRQKDYERAAEVFERAVERDPENDYAHHYYAFNLDVEGRQPDTVEEHYRNALELEDEHAWWWSRWICFLITRGRFEEAEEAWDFAQDALGLPDPDASLAVYTNLHKWVARHALHSLEFDLAESVLRSVPPDVRRNIRGFEALDRLLKRLRDADRREVYFPAHIGPDERWDQPHLVSRRHLDGGAGLETWFAGRVEAVDEEHVYLQLAERPDGEEEPAPKEMDVPVEKFDEWTLDERAGELSEGRFVEMGLYDELQKPVVRVHPKKRWESEGLPPLWPRPDRYLRRQGLTDG